MNRLRKFGRTWTALLVCAAGGFAADAQETNRQSGVEYPSFKIIVDLNIFNANRSGRRESAPPETRLPVRVDSFALVGTMSYGKGEFAFFDGTSADYRKTLQPGGTIAGHQVTAVAPSGVRLKTDEQEIEMNVGSQMRREDDGPWQPAQGTGDYSSGRSERRSETGTNSSGNSDGPAALSNGSAGGDASEVLKRLMEAREQENK